MYHFTTKLMFLTLTVFKCFIGTCKIIISIKVSEEWDHDKYAYCHENDELLLFQDQQQETNNIPHKMILILHP